MFKLNSKAFGKRTVLGSRPATRTTLATTRPPINNLRKPR